MRLSADDRAALIERVAAAMWESRRQAGDPPSAKAPAFWRERFVELATVAVNEVCNSMPESVEQLPSGY